MADIDIEGIWRSHKRFITKVGAGALAFAVLSWFRGAVESEARTLAGRNASDHAALASDLARLENAEGLEKGRAEALSGQLEPAVLQALLWRPEAGFVLPEGERSPALFYAAAAARAATEVSRHAARWNATCPSTTEGLGLPPEVPPERVEEALVRADVTRRVVMRLLDAGVRSFLRVEPLDAAYAPRRGGEGFVRALPVRVAFAGTTPVLAAGLRELQTQGTFLEVTSCRVARPDGERGAREDAQSVELELRALSLVATAPQGALTSGDGGNGGRPAHGGRVRRFGRER